jgi:hypothetical protein
MRHARSIRDARQVFITCQLSSSFSSFRFSNRRRFHLVYHPLYHPLIADEASTHLKQRNIMYVSNARVTRLLQQELFLRILIDVIFLERSRCNRHKSNTSNKANERLLLSLLWSKQKKDRYR